MGLVCAYVSQSSFSFCFLSWDAKWRSTHHIKKAKEIVYNITTTNFIEKFSCFWWEQSLCVYLFHTNSVNCRIRITMVWKVKNKYYKTKQNKNGMTNINKNMHTYQLQKWFEDESASNLSRLSSLLSLDKQFKPSTAPR